MRRETDPREVARDAFRRATGEREPALDAMLEKTPAMLQAARRRRAGSTGRAELWPTLLPLVGRSLPAFAVAAAVLVASVGWLWARDDRTAVDGTATVAGWLLGSDEPAAKDAVFEALIAGQGRPEEETP